MLKVVLWIAAACAVVLVVLAVSRARLTSEPMAKEAAPAVQQAAQPAVAQVPEPPPPPPAPPKLPEVDPQVADDAAAVGMTTREVPAEEPPAPEKAPQPQ